MGVFAGPWKGWMGFSNLPRTAQAYLAAICVFGLGAALAVLMVTWPSAKGSHIEMALFVLLATVLGGKKITLFRHVGDDDAVSMSMGFVITFAGMLRFGATGAFAMSALSCLAGCLYPRRQPLYQMVFNVSLSALEALAGSVVYLALNGWTLEMSPIQTFLAICGATVVYFLSNTGGVSIIIGLCSGERPWKIWRESFLWTCPSYFAGACLSGLSMVLFGNNLGYILLFVAPVAYFTYHSYSVYSARAEEKVKHLEEMQQNQARLADLYLATIKSLALAIDAKDQYTHQHILRVQRYAVAIAKQMGLDGGDLEAVNTGALLHDIGKLGVPEYVLLKPGRLTEDEFAKIKLHPEIGAAILDPVEFPWPVLPVVKYHHEKWDGSGYPEGLAGEDIPLTARIMAVADVYDALTSSRSYRSAWTHERAFDVICKDAGTHFDPVVVEAFKLVIEEVIDEMAEVGEGPRAEKTNLTEPVLDKAAQAATAISRTSSDLWALYEVADTLSSCLGLQDTMEILGRKIGGNFPGATCLFLLKNEEGNGLRVRTAFGLNRDYFENAQTIGIQSASMKVMASAESYLGEYDPDDILVNGHASAQWEPLQSALVVPIPHEGQVFGTINLYHPELGAFSKHDRQLLETVAERAAMALFNGILHDRAHSLPTTDSLTGVHNMGYLTEEIERKCRDGEHFSLLCFDLDNFKPINDNFGHQKGDQVLLEIAGILKANAGPRDVVARYGGDQFLILTNDVDPESVGQIVDRVLAAIEDHDAELLHFSLGSLKLEASHGIARFPESGRDGAGLLAVAIASLHERKNEKKLRMLSDRSSKPRRNPRAA